MLSLGQGHSGPSAMHHTADFMATHKGTTDTSLTAVSSTTATASAVVVPTFSLDAIKSALANVGHDVAAFVNPVTPLDDRRESAEPKAASTTSLSSAPRVAVALTAATTTSSTLSADIPAGDATASKGGDPSLGGQSDANAPRQRLRREVLYEQLLPFAKRGLTASKAAEELAIPYTTALAIYNDPDFRREVLAPYRAVFGPIDNAYLDNKVALIRRIELGAERAFDKLMEILDDPDAPRSVQAAVARDLLDRRADTRAGRNDSTTVTTVSIDAAALLAAASAARAMDASQSPKVTPIRKSA